jgi:hypothetical protein
MNSMLFCAASRSTSARAGRSKSFTRRGAVPARCSQTNELSFGFGASDGVVAQSASLLVLGIPYHSSNP